MANSRPECPDRPFVLYWMTAARRPWFNPALERAAQHAARLGKPLVVFEALRVGHLWAAERFHQFVAQGMLANARAFAGSAATYLPYIEPHANAGAGLLEFLAARSAVVVADDFPCFFLPALLRLAAAKVDVRLEAVDGNGLAPMHVPDRVFDRAFSFRGWLHRNLPPHLEDFPRPNPLAGLRLPRGEFPGEIPARWPSAPVAGCADGSALAALPIDHAVGPVADRGGWEDGRARLTRFLDERLSRYADERNVPDERVASELSAHLHFGHLSSHEIFSALAAREEWTPARLAAKPTGSREGWWGMSGPAESFLDEFVTWRELGYNMCAKLPGYDRYESLPAWARQTLADHEADPRPYVYALDQLEGAATHDPLWNAAQRQLAREGRIHNYLRMLWGKKILEWSPGPRAALAALIELNNKYALDGRNPNSYSGIFWTLGRYDRAWGPERPIYGKIRYMTSENTARKVAVKNYLRRYAEAPALFEA